MYTYKLMKDPISGNLMPAVKRSDGASVPCDPANTDYQNFKKQINADEAQLEDADGNTMTPEEAKAYIEELP